MTKGSIVTHMEDFVQFLKYVLFSRNPPSSSEMETAQFTLWLKTAWVESGILIGWTCPR